MNTIVREMNPTEEIELTDTQLEAVYGGCDKEWQSQVVCQPYVGYRPQLAWGAKPACPEQEKSSSVLVHKKVVFSFEEDFSIKKDEEEKGYSNSY